MNALWVSIKGTLVLKGGWIYDWPHCPPYNSSKVHLSTKVVDCLWNLVSYIVYTICKGPNIDA